jgi:RNA polymerase sigma-70 factor, ECF subfamily
MSHDRSGEIEASDEELVSRFRGGDQLAFATLVRRHERRVYNLAYRMLGRAEDSKEATQEALLSCFRHLHRFRGDAAFTTWLHRIAVNACYDLMRKRTPQPVEDVELFERIPASDHADSTAAAIDVQRALVKVPLEFRAVLVMHDVQGFPYEEIADALGIPLGTVKSRLHRGRMALARQMSGEPEGARAPSKPPIP